MDSQKTLESLAIEQLLQPQIPPTKKETPTGVRTQNRVYSNKDNAIDAAKPYSNFVRADVYVYESSFGTGDFQYTLRVLSEIFSPDSDYIVHTERYVAPIPKQEFPTTPKSE